MAHGESGASSQSLRNRITQTGILQGLELELPDLANLNLRDHEPETEATRSQSIIGLLQVTADQLQLISTTNPTGVSPLEVQRENNARSGRNIPELIQSYKRDLPAEIDALPVLDVASGQLGMFQLLNQEVDRYLRRIEERLPVYACFWSSEEIKQVVYWILAFKRHKRLVESVPPQRPRYILDRSTLRAISRDSCSAYTTFEAEILPRYELAHAASRAGGVARRTSR
ncbi:hypothetical protein OBBRIDRAFT_804061 [Obba rivulosa]|uniref:Uncharacterized protein n=1 Tax=Obba rivulosa TaxID=1052685 RepID=A0A8E2AY19_9APHY|nr:hypothetical protein OBBRIDRAFT_804061 [Obba rivulosa]